MTRASLARMCEWQLSVMLLMLLYGVVEPAVAQRVWKTTGILGPMAVAVVPGGMQMLVACADARQVLWVSLPDGEVRRRVDVPGEATGLALSPDGRQLFVTCASAHSSVLQIDVASGEVLRTIVAGHTAVSPVLDSAGDQLFVCNRFDDSVSIFAVSSGTELACVSVPREPVAAALTPDRRRLLVANHLPHRSANPKLENNVNAVVTVVDTNSYSTTNIELYSGASSVRGICVTPDGKFALVTHLLSNFESVPFRVAMGWINVNVVSVIDLERKKTLTTIGLDELQEGVANPWGICCSEDGKLVWVATAGSHQLNYMSTSDLVGDAARRTMSPLPGAWPVYPSLGESLWKRVALPGRGPRGVTVVGNTAYSAEYYSDSIAAVSVDETGIATVRSIPLGALPDPTLERRGQMLFDDATICFQHWQSCSSCHPDGRVDGLNWDLMNDGVGNPKNSKSLLLSHQTPPAMVKGVRETAELAVRSGLTHVLFAYRPEEEALAIDAYLRSLQPVPSPHLEAGQLSQAARRGKKLFEGERGACSRCHPAPLYTDKRMHRIGKAASSYFQNRYDTPTLLEVWRTAPYLHDGQFATVKQLLLEGKHGLRHDTTLNEQEAEALAEYVLSL